LPPPLVPAAHPVREPTTSTPAAGEPRTVHDLAVGTSPLGVTRSIAETASAPDLDSVPAQLQPESAPVDVAGIQRAQQGASEGVAASTHEHGGGELNVDELAARLYDRIRARLRDELLIDRERAGLVTDVR
jgi:hypothetical protein